MALFKLTDKVLNFVPVKGIDKPLMCGDWIIPVQHSHNIMVADALAP